MAMAVFAILGIVLRMKEVIIMAALGFLFYLIVLIPFYLLIVLGILLRLMWALAGFILVKCKQGENPKKDLYQIFLMLLLMPLVVADDIVGSIQLNNLCAEKPLLTVSPEKARGRTVKHVAYPKEVVPFKTLPITRLHYSNLDVLTGEEIAQNDWYYAEGGWLMRSMGVLQGNPPITGFSSCYTSMNQSLTDYDINVIY